MMRAGLNQARRAFCKQLAHNRSRELSHGSAPVIFDGCRGGAVSGGPGIGGASLATTGRLFSSGLGLVGCATK